MELDAVQEGVVVDRPGVGSASTKGLEVGAAGQRRRPAVGDAIEVRGRSARVADPR
jgi:hypothetical protein